MSELTENQIEFVRYLVRGGCTPTKAARLAGYSHAKQRAAELLRKEHIIAAIRREQACLLDGDLTNIAFQTLRGVMQDAQSPASAKVAASRAVLEASGYFKRDREKPLEEKDFLAMTDKELEAFIRQGKEQVALMAESAGRA